MTIRDMEADATLTGRPGLAVSPVPSVPLPSPTLNALITYALAEATWAEQAIHPAMTPTLRKHHVYHSHMHLMIARRLEELKEITTT